jgi:O-antigen/teichoic acid export membrane protein
MLCESSSGEPRGRNRIRRFDRVLDYVRPRRQHARNLFSQFLSRIIALASFAIALPFFIHRQGAASYGILALLLSIYTFLVLLDLGVSYSVGLRIGRSLARGDGRAPLIFSRALPLAIVLGGAVFAVLAATARPISLFLYSSSSYTDAIRVFGVTVAIYIVSSTPAAVVQIYHRVDWFNYSKLIGDVAKAGGLVLGGISRHPIDTAMWVLVAGASIKFAVDMTMAAYLLGRVGPIHIRPNWSDVRANLTLGLPMSIAGLASIALTSGDRVLASRLFGPLALANYSLAVDICGKAYFLVWAITGTIYPMVVRNASSRREVNSYRRIGLISVLTVAVVIYLPIALFAHRAISWWLGPQMGRGAGLVTSVWAFIAVAYLLTSVLQFQLQAKGRPLLLVCVNLAGIGILLSGAYLLPRAYGILGIAVLMGFVYLAQFCMLWVLDNAAAKTSGRRPAASTLRGIASPSSN